MIIAILPKRGSDNYGSGAFGASRGGRSHNGIDYACHPGSKILSPVNGKVTKLGYPYADDLSYRYVQVTDDEGLDHRIFYVSPEVVTGDVVMAGVTVVGEAQNICRRYPRTTDKPAGMTNHIHYEIKGSGRYINPEMQ